MKSSPSKTVPVQSTSGTITEDHHPKIITELSPLYQFQFQHPSPEIDTEGEELKSKENFQLHLEVFCFYNYFVNKKNKKKEG